MIVTGSTYRIVYISNRKYWKIFYVSYYQKKLIKFYEGGLFNERERVRDRDRDPGLVTTMGLLPGCGVEANVKDYRGVARLGGGEKCGRLQGYRPAGREIWKTIGCGQAWKNREI